MLYYEYRIRDEFDRVRQYATNLRRSFEIGRASEELLLDTRNLQVLCGSLRELLPEEVRGATNLGRHLGFMVFYLEKDEAQNCRGDIADICDKDLVELEAAFREWVRAAVKYDDELARGVSDLLVRREYDSAMRKAFVILRGRLAARFGVGSGVDGDALVNQVFGGKPHAALRLDDGERQAWRNLLAGLFGVFRNRVAHEDVQPSWQEADAVISMVNHVLTSLDQIAPRAK